MYTTCLLGQKQLNPPAKSKEVLVVVVLFALLPYRVLACMDKSNETYFKLQELARKKVIYEIYNLFPRPRLKKSRCFDGHDNFPFMASLSISPGWTNALHHVLNLTHHILINLGTSQKVKVY